MMQTPREATQRLSAGAKHMLRILQRLSEASARRGLPYAFPRGTLLAEEMGVSRGEVSKRASELKKAGAVRIERAPEAGGRNRYFLADLDTGEFPSLETPGVSTVETPGVSTVETPVFPTSETPEFPAPLLGDSIQQQQATAAAAEKLRPEDEAAGALIAAGIPESGHRGARAKAKADPAFCRFVLAFYIAEREAKKYGTLGVPFLRDCLNNPAKHGITQEGGEWKAPPESMIYKNMREAEIACNRTAAKESVRRQEEARAAEEAANAPARAAQQAADAAAWDGLPDDERRSIERIVRKSHPLVPADGFSFRTQCVLLMRKFLAAQVEAAALAALDAAERAHVEALARQLWPVFCSTEPGFRNACLMVLANRRAAAEATP